ncbi:MAG: hypothetical protein JSW18_04705 [Candidatus Omnitrophota bacterium]|nr:MAG: hypothetical protein JSW18_04705 [Candidatus Omnitrophota bacterium]
MQKQKIEKILVLVLLPLFVLGLILRFIGRIKQRPLTAPVPVSQVEEKKEYIKEEAKVLEKVKPKLEKVEYKAGDFLDPLKDRLSIYIASIATKAKKKEPIAINPPQFNITGLIWNTDRPQAIIDGKVLSVGDEIKGAKLLSVNKEGIKVEYRKAEFFIEK